MGQACISFWERIFLMCCGLVMFFFRRILMRSDYCYLWSWLEVAFAWVLICYSISLSDALALDPDQSSGRKALLGIIKISGLHVNNHASLSLVLTPSQSGKGNNGSVCCQFHGLCQEAKDLGEEWTRGCPFHNGWLPSSPTADGQKQEVNLGGGASGRCFQGLSPNTPYKISVYAQYQGMEGPAVTTMDKTRKSQPPAAVVHAELLPWKKHVFTICTKFCLKPEWSPCFDTNWSWCWPPQNHTFASGSWGLAPPPNLHWT